MAHIKITDLSFSYDTSLTAIFEHVNLNLDSTWRLGLVGRNGRGKTTFLNILMGKLEYTGAIECPLEFEYFPAKVHSQSLPALFAAREIIAPFAHWEEEMRQCIDNGDEGAMARYGNIEEQYAAANGYVINELMEAEAGRIGITAEALLRPYKSLSGGEQVKLMLAALFLKRHSFLLIDEPTDHLDADGRKLVAKWLAKKSGFILVSHDRAFLDETIDHVLSINKSDIELQAGNYTSWRQNRTMQDEYEFAENRRLQKNIAHLKEASRRTAKWADNVEKSKVNGPDSYSKGSAAVDRGYIGHKSAKMMQRAKSIELRREKEIEEKSQLLKNIEEAEPIRFQILPSEKKILAQASGLSFAYGAKPLLANVNFTLNQGMRLVVQGGNGSGKSTLLALIKGAIKPNGGHIRLAPGIVISDVLQTTGALCGSVQQYAEHFGIQQSLFMAILRKLNFERELFLRDMQSYSAGQKKKVLLAASLAKPAHLFIWDEPLNYIDVLSREQIEEAVLKYRPSMLFVEHDETFTSRVATDVLRLDS